MGLEYYSLSSKGKEFVQISNFMDYALIICPTELYMRKIFPFGFDLNKPILKDSFVERGMDSQPIVIYKALCFDVAQGRMNWAPNENRTHSCRLVSQAC